MCCVVYCVYHDRNTTTDPSFRRKTGTDPDQTEQMVAEKCRLGQDMQGRVKVKTPEESSDLVTKC